MVLKENKMKNFKKVISGLLFYIIGIAFLFPVLWIASISLRAKKDIFSISFFIKEIHFENYVVAWKTFQFSRLFLNSIIVAIFSIIVTLIISSLAGYSFSKLKYKGSNIIFVIILLGIMIPQAGILIPYFSMMRVMGLYNTLIALILSYIAFGIPISVLIFRGFFAGIPNELIEAARIDGYSEIGIFTKICIPISRPAIATVIILLFVNNWNEFILALVLLRDEPLYTLPLGIARYIGEWDSPWNLIAAGVIISVIPITIAYLFLQNQFVKGLTEGAIKG
ncbi:MAG: carbohydrate ABC transporter permease [Actinobacteria bacterium]|nr:carbohydrate ABC transporter permease [Actinomycetota bacterium]